MAAEAIETTNGASLPSLDHSCEVAIHLNQAVAIADLVATVCGNDTDGSGSRIDELASTTLYDAMHCIQQNIDAAREFQSKMDERDYEITAARQAAQGGAHG